jgi:hypothetical protein
MMMMNMRTLLCTLVVAATSLVSGVAAQVVVTTDLATDAVCGAEDPCVRTFVVDSGINDVSFSMAVVGSTTTYLNAATFRALPGDEYTITRSAASASMSISGPVYNQDGRVDGATNIMSRVDGSLTQSAFLTALTSSTDASTESRTVFTSDAPCDPPQALEKNLNPRLMPTSRLYVDNGVAKLELTVEIPSYYYDVQFSWNHAGAAPVVNALADTLVREPDQCPGSQFDRFVATSTSIAGAFSCMSWYTVSIAYADFCTFDVDTSDAANLIFSGTLYVIAKTTFSGDVAIGAFQEVVSPINWQRSIATQITVSSAFEISNEDECGADEDCGRALCNGNRGTETAGGRVCGANKVGVCHWASSNKYVSLCVSTNAIFNNGHSIHANDVIPPVAAIGYAGSDVFLGAAAGPLSTPANPSFDYAALLSAQCEFTPLPAVCDCSANGWATLGLTCGGDIEAPEWIDCGLTGEVSVTATWTQLEADPSLSVLFSGANGNPSTFPTIRDNSGDGLTVVSTVFNTGAANGAAATTSLTLNGGTGLYEIQPVTEIDVLVYSVRIVMVADDSSAESQSAQCAINLTVTDDKPPVVTCPAFPVGAPLRTNVWQNAWENGDVSAVDEKDGSLTATTTTDMSSDPAQGLHEVTYSATDTALNTGTCSFFVYFDSVAPTFDDCASYDVAINTDANQPFGSYTWANPSVTDEATDSCTGSVTGAQSSTGCTVTSVAIAPATASPFTTGVQTRAAVGTFTATDSLGNASTCIFYIAVTDNQPPQTSCDQAAADAAGLNALSMSPGQNYASLPGMSAFFGATDNVGVVGSGFSPSAGAQLQAGSNAITFGASDAVPLSDSCTLVVTVVDTEAPTTTTCVAAQTFAVRDGQDDGTWTSAIAAPTFADNHAPLIPTDVTHTITMAGNAGFTGAIGDEWAVGVYTISWSAKDTAQNENTLCVMTITVQDVTPPTVDNCNAVLSFTHDTDLDAATWTPSLGSHWITTLSAHDNVLVTSTTMDGQSVAAFLSSPLALGSHTITYEATDSAGLTSQCTFTVTVEDNQEPTADCSTAAPTGAIVSTETYASASGTANRFLVSHPFDKDAANAYTLGVGADNVPGEFDVASGTSTDNNPLPYAGLYTLTVTTIVIDRNGNPAATCEFQIKVIDTTDPTTDCALAGDAVRAFTTDAGESYATISFNDNGAMADDVGVMSTAFTYLGADAQSTRFESGAPTGATYSILYTVNDHYGHSSSCSFDIVVRDAEDPTSSLCPSGSLAAATVGTDARVATYSGVTWNPTFGDNVAVATTTVSSLNGGVTTTLSAWPAIALPLGLNVITVLATDTSGNSNTCTFSITVEDREAPFPDTADDLCSHVSIARNADFGTTIWTPGASYVSPEDGKTRGGFWSPQAEPTWIDNVDGTAAVITMSDEFAAGTSANPTATVTQAVTYGSVLDAGIHTITVTATDAANNQATCSFIINVGDDQGPLLECPQDVTVPTNAGVNGNSGPNYYDGGFASATGSDNQGPVTPTTTTSQSTQFPMGPTTITFSADDSAYNSSPITTTCTFVITVVDVESPIIQSCGGPASSISAVTNGQGVVVHTVAMDSYGTASYSGGWAAPSSTDNIGVDSTTFVATGSVTQASALALGEHTVTYTVDDVSTLSGSATCSFIIVVVDTYDPIAVCAGIASTLTGIIDNTPDQDYWLGDFSIPSGAIEDNVPGVTSALTVGTAGGVPAQGHQFQVVAPAGQDYTIVLTATDAGGRTNSCSFVITVADTQDPWSNEYTSSDPASPSVINSADGVATFPTDPSGGVQCNSSAGSTRTGSWFGFAPAFTTSDNVAVATVTLTVTNAQAGLTDATILENGELQVGLNVIKYVIVDTSGNSSTRYISITVVDREQPSIACPASLTLTLPAADSTTAVTASPSSAGQPITAAVCDNVDSDSLYNVAAFNAKTFAQGGPYAEPFTHDDAAGNTGTCTTTVTVVDATPPTVTAQNIEIDTTGKTSPVTFIIATTNNGPRTVTVTDSVTGAVVTTDSTEFPIGVTTCNVSVTDGTFTTTTSFTVTVWDNQAPVPTCPANLALAVSYDLDGTAQTQTVAHALVSLTDNNGPICDPTSSITISATHDSLGAVADVNELQFGVTTITYNVNDNACLQARGLANTCSFTVTITDEVKPVPSQCETTLTVNSMINGVRSLAGGWTVPTWSDNYDVDTTLTLGGSGPGPADDLTLGPNAVTYTAVDASTNAEQCAMIVTLVDTAPPQIACPVDVPLALALSVADGDTTVDYSYTMTATDDLTARADICIRVNAAGDCLTLTANDQYSSTLGFGRTDFAFTATDDAGLTHSCAWFVYVADITPPTVPAGECPADFELRASGQLSESALLSFTSGSGVARTLTFNDASVAVATSIDVHFTDNVDVEADIISTFSGVPAGGVFPIGTTTVFMLGTDSSLNRIEADGTITRRGVATTDTATPCSFTVTVLHEYEPLPAQRSVFLNRVFIQEIDAVTNSFGAYVEITTNVPWPHRLAHDTTPAAGTLNPLEISSVCPTTTSTAAAHLSEDCDQVFGTVVEFPTGCSISQQKYQLSMASFCNNGVTDCVYASQDWVVEITLSADNYCAVDLSEVEVTATLRTYTADALSAFTADPANPPASSEIFFDGDQINGVVQVASPSVLLQSTTLISIFSVRAGQTTTLYNTAEGGSTTGTITEPGTSLAAPTATYHAFDYPAVVAVDTSVNVVLEATVALDYVLQLNGGRRLLRKIVNVKLNRPRALLQAADAQETERTAKAPYTALNIKLDGANVRANADGSYSVIVGRIILSLGAEPTNEEATALARVTTEQIQTHLGVDVSANVLRVQGNSVIMSIAHDESKTSLLKEQFTDANSDLNTKLRSNVQFAFDPEYFFEGDVESTNFQKPSSSDDDASLPAIIGGVAAGASSVVDLASRVRAGNGRQRGVEHRADAGGVQQRRHRRREPGVSKRSKTCYIVSRVHL